MNPNDAITIVIPTSPLAINPSTQIIDETYQQVRKHLPEARMIILVDGVHPEEGYLEERYWGYKNNLDMKVLREWKNAETRTHAHWEHQSGMLRKLILEDDDVKTPLVFWSEHDIPLRDEFIDWPRITNALVGGHYGALRFELTGDPPKYNECQGFDREHGIPVQLSTQFVNWPQVFRLDYFKEFLALYGNAKTYLECAECDGAVATLWNRGKRYGIYSPEPEIRRCYHTHGRRATGVEQGKPYIEVNGKRRHIYGGYTSTP